MHHPFYKGELLLFEKISLSPYKRFMAHKKRLVLLRMRCKCLQHWTNKPPIGWCVD
jgi:hypothetical protein